MTLRLPAVMTAFIALVAVAHAQTPVPSRTISPPALSGAPSTATVTQVDQTFATKAAQAGTAEIADAKLALQNSSRQDVKDFAQHMVDDHSKAAGQLKSIASGENITLPTTESSADQKNTDSLQKLNGAAFDKQYIRGQRKAHKQAVALFTKESKSGTDDSLKTFANQTLPTLQDHLQMVTALPVTAKSAAASK